MGEKPIDASLLILAGGQGNRMGGENKLYMKIGGSVLAEQIITKLSPIFKEIIVIVARGEKEQALSLLKSLSVKDIRIEEDSVPGLGPLEGLRSGLASMEGEWGFFIGCDMPSIDKATVRLMHSQIIDESDALCAEKGGYIEPLHAFYRKTCLRHVQSAIKLGHRKTKSFYPYINLTVIKENDLILSGGNTSSFLNLNTPCDLEKFQKEQCRKNITSE